MNIGFGLIVVVMVIGINLPDATGQGEVNLVDMDYFSDSALYVKQAKFNIQKYHIEPAAKSIREGNFGAALGDIDFALRYFPNHPTALQLLRMVAQLQKKPALAIKYYEKALDMFPQHAITHAQYGAYLVASGNVNQGLDKLHKAIEIDPKLAAAQALLSQAYRKIGNVELADRAAEQARQLGYQGKIE